jgi:NADH:ubiquinone oxidoreductase subunit 4 (subunit M)
LAPVHTILPDAKIKAVVRGSRIRMMAAANRFGLYSTFLHLLAMSRKSKFLQFKFAVETMFWSFGMSDWLNGW